MPKLAPLQLQAIIIKIGLNERPILQLQNEWPSSTYTGATREEITANEGFENTRLSTALASDYSNLRQLNLGELGGTERSEYVLELVDDRNYR